MSARTRIRLAVLLLFGVLLFARGLPAQANGEIRIVPIGPAADVTKDFERAILISPQARAALRGIRYRVLGMASGADQALRAVERGVPVSETYVLLVYDYSNDRLLEISGGLGDFRTQKIEPSLLRPDPVPEEYEEAVRILRQDRTLGRFVKSGALVPYQAMPLLLEPGEAGGNRVLPIGLRPVDPELDHEIVAVDVSSGRTTRFARKAPGPSIATKHVCGPVSAGQSVTKIGTSGTSIIEFLSGGAVLWRMKVTRPAASAGRWGSGIELREVYYRDRLVLHRAHVPILNVDYARGECGPYRDPVNNENSFQVTGTPAGRGFMKSSGVPQTIFETKKDRGNFRGVAVYEDSSQLVLVSELSAGWYRYASEFRFYPDGRIQPLFKFDAVHNSCTCLAHNHHVYWRFDFDVDGGNGNSVEVLGATGWRQVATEEMHIRDADHRQWRVLNRKTGRAYTITPGPYDRTANEFGRGDVWVLRYNGREMDDSRFGSSKDAKISSFLNDEPVADSDVVLWYGGHILHDGDSSEVPHIAGPMISP